MKLESVQHEDGFGDVLIVSGADLMDGTPIYDVKPYLPYADAHPEALGGFAPSPKETIEVKSPPELLQKLPEGRRCSACSRRTRARSTRTTPSAYTA